MIIEDRRAKRKILTYRELDNLTTFRFLNKYNAFNDEICLKVGSHFVALESGNIIEQNCYLQEQVEILNSKLIIE